MMILGKKPVHDLPVFQQDRQRNGMQRQDSRRGLGLLDAATQEISGGRRSVAVPGLNLAAVGQGGLPTVDEIGVVPGKIAMNDDLVAD